MRRDVQTLLTLACLVGTTLPARAEFKTWTGGAAGTNTSWSAPGNWSPAGVPAAGDSINLYGLLNVSPVVHYDYAPAVIFANVTVTHSNPNPDLRPRPTTLNISAFNFSTASESIGDSRIAGSQGWGSVSQTGAVHTITGSLPLLLGVAFGNAGQDRGTYSLTGGTLHSTSGLTLGVDGEGLFTHSAGVVTLPAGSLTLGQNASGTGRYTFHTGTLTAASAIVGLNGAGTFTQTGGLASIQGSLTLGQNATSTGGFSLSGGSLQAGHLTVSGVGAFHQTGGTTTLGTASIRGTLNLSQALLTTSGSISLGRSTVGAFLNIGAGGDLRLPGGPLLMNLDGALTVSDGGQVFVPKGASISGIGGQKGTITLTGSGSRLRGDGSLNSLLTIGGQTEGAFHILAGATADQIRHTTLGDTNFGRGTLTLNGPGTSLHSQGILLGNSGFGQASILHGDVVAGNTSVASQFGSTGIILLSGTASTWTTLSSTVAFQGSGTLSISGGATFHNTDLLQIGAFSGGSGRVSVDGPGSLLIVNGTTFLGTGTGSLSITNGGTALLRDIDESGSGANALTLDGGTLDLQGHALGIDTPIDNLHLRAGTLKNVKQINNGATGLVKTGPGTLALPTANTYTGGAKVQQGTLLVQHPGALNGGAFTLEGSSRAALQLPPGAAARVALLTLAGSTNNWTAQLDLSSAALVISASPAIKDSLVPTLRNQILSGSAGGTWTGNGITSSTLPGLPSFTLALFDNADLRLAAFGGLVLSDSDLLLTIARPGDATLDGKVDAFDLNLLAANWQLSGPTLTWSDGDFTLDGKVDAFDLNLLASMWQSGASSVQPQQLAALLATGETHLLPEPASLLLLTPLTALLLRRRRQMAGDRMGRWGAPHS